MTARSMPVACSRLREPLDLDVVGLVAVLARASPGRRARTGSARLARASAPAPPGDRARSDAPRNSAAAAASLAGAIAEGVDAHALLANAAEIDVGSDQGRIARKALGLGELIAAFEDRGVAVPGEIGRRFAGARGRIGVGGDGARRLAGAQQAAGLGLADGDVAGRQVDEDLGAGERRARDGGSGAQKSSQISTWKVNSTDPFERNRRSTPNGASCPPTCICGGGRRRRRRNGGAHRTRGSWADSSSARRRGSCRDGSRRRC